MQNQPSRRRFLQTASLGAAVGAAVGATGIGWPSAARSADSAGSGKQKFELGLASYSLRKFSLGDALKMTQRVGLKHICLKSMHLPLEASGAEIAAAAEQVRQAGIRLYGGGVIKMQTAEQARHAFAYAKAAGMTTIVGVPAPDQLVLVDKLVKEYDIKVAIHNHGPGDETYPTPESAYEKVKNLDPRIGLCIDVGHTIRIGADPYKSVTKYVDRLHDVHIKDVTAADPSGKNAEVGRGVMDIPKLLKNLVRSGYSGVVAFEFEKDAEDPLAGLAESVGYVRGVLDCV